MAKIKFSNVTKQFGNFTAVDKLNLEIKDQEFLTFVGPSGCGKTTSLRMLAGLEEVTAGDILIDDQVINELSPKDRNIAMVFQSYALYPHYTIYDNLAFGLRNKLQNKWAHVLLFLIKLGIYSLALILYWVICRFLFNSIPFIRQNNLINIGTGEYFAGNLLFYAGIIGFILMMMMFSDTREEINELITKLGTKISNAIVELQKSERMIKTKVYETAKLLNIETQLWKKPKQLSGGQRQRVALGRAIIRNPKAFLMDEPLSNLDAKLRVQMRAELERLTNRLKVTTIYVTHDQIEAMTLSDRIAVMNEGKVNQVGTPDEVYNYPVNTFVAGFIGSPAMNFVKGKIEAKNDEMWFVSEAFSYPVPDFYKEGLKEFLNKEIILGIRPEHIYLVEDSNIDHKTLKGTVGVLEPIGAETYVYIDFPAYVELILKEEGIKKVKVDQTVYIRIREKYLHFFDSESKCRVLPEGGIVKTHHDSMLGNSL